MHKLRFSLCLLLLLAFSIAPQAQDTPEAKPEAATEVEHYNYFFYYMGSRIGWLKYAVKNTELDGREVRHEKATGFISITRSFDGATFESKLRSEEWLELDGRQIREIDVRESGSQEHKVEVTYRKDAADITETVDDGTPSKATLDYGDRAVRGDFEVWLELKECEPKKGEKLQFWSVDGDNHALVEQTWTVNGKVKRKLHDGDVVEGTEIRIVKSGRAATLIYGDDDMPLRYEDVSGFTLERTKEIPEPFKAEPVSLDSVMTANVAITDFKDLEQLDIHFKYEHDDGDGIEQLLDSNEYHDVIKYDEGYAVRMKARKLPDDFKAPSYPLEEVPDDVKKYLAPTAMCQSDDEVLVAEADKLAKGKKDAVELARAIMRFTDKHLKSVTGDTGSASARQAYDEARGDCTEHAVLFCALARAAGLPARSVSGVAYVCSPDGSVSLFGYHAWAEVWLGEWVPVDPTVLELGTSARYLYFGTDEPGETYGGFRINRSMRQGIKPVIDAYRLEDETEWKRDGAKKFEWK